MTFHLRLNIVIKKIDIKNTVIYFLNLTLNYTVLNGFTVLPVKVLTQKAFIEI